ncbi:DUF2188 domain-containing protein [Leuconostoc mesenteroides]|uniref:DUF2188 domain-containing protein n=1 Tax=Leuconostoc mesenteroides TaxID=1245 RepID=UPI001CC113EE|nr:DUF2188 domain-containing protein [Leuconostoc mesenteroides]MBZ1526990.1 DUF2188 domain-containing protein [Leuconostoc mesenteroides]
MGKNQHVVPDGAGGWNVKGEGNSRATANYAKQSDAVKKAKDIAKNQNSEELTHGRDGKIRDRSSYGNDSHPPKG